MAGFPDYNAGDGELHGASGLDAVRLRVAPHDLDGVDHGRSFTVPDRGFHSCGRGRAAMRADKAERWTGAFHEESGGAVSVDAGMSQSGEVKFQRRMKTVDAFWKVEVGVALAQCFLERGSVVGDSISEHTQSTDIGLSVRVQDA